MSIRSILKRADSQTSHSWDANEESTSSDAKNVIFEFECAIDNGPFDEDFFYRKQVLCWGDLTVYEFPMMLGDNPSVSDGPPLTIDWKHTNEHVFDIDYFEYMRRPVQLRRPSASAPMRQLCGSGSNPRKPHNKLLLDKGIRGALLLNIGYSIQDIVAATTEVDLIKRSRRNNMKGRYDSFKTVFQHFSNIKTRVTNSASAKSQPSHKQHQAKARIVASKSA